MKSLGQMIKSIRHAHKYSLKVLSSHIDIDVSLLSRIENDERLPTEEQIIRFCEHFKDSAHQLKVQWLSSKIISDIKSYEAYAEEALHVAEQIIKYQKEQ